MENGPVEIVDFPIHSMVDLSIAKCDSSPEGMQSDLRYNSAKPRHAWTPDLQILTNSLV